MGAETGVAVDLTPDIHGFQAYADYTDEQFHAVKRKDDDDVQLCDDGTSNHGEHVLGILIGRHDEDEECDIRCEGVVPVIVDADSTSISAGDPLKTNASGHFIKAESSSDISCYEALEAADSDGAKILAIRTYKRVLA